MFVWRLGGALDLSYLGPESSPDGSSPPLVAIENTLNTLMLRNSPPPHTAPTLCSKGLSVAFSLPTPCQVVLPK